MTSEDSRPFHWHYAEFDDSNFEIRGRTLFFIIVLFSIIIFIILIFLYAKWMCRQFRLALSRTTTSAEQLAHAPPQGLDPGIIERFPVVVHGASSEASCNLSQLECCICLGIFEDDEKVKVLPNCHHCYHCECVDKWLKTHATCPLCRASLRLRVDSTA